MNQSRNAFTMVELIFVIVIIGILASLAIPRLAASRDDAIDAKDCKNISVCITDMAAEYTARETTTKNDSPSCVRVEASSKNSISVSINNNSISIAGAPSACSQLNRTFYFGGSRVSI